MPGEKRSVKEFIDQKGRSIERYLNTYVGCSIKEVVGVDSLADLERREMGDVLGREIVVLGYTEMPGKRGTFYVLAVYDIETDSCFTVGCGGSVVMKKLQLVAEKDGFPVTGKIDKPANKEYYDFT